MIFNTFINYCAYFDFNLDLDKQIYVTLCLQKGSEEFSETNENK